MYRRSPKFGFTNLRTKVSYELVHLKDLEAHFKDGDLVNTESLREKGLVRGSEKPVKVLSTGTLTKRLNLQVDKVTKSVKALVEKMGGTLVAAEEK